jgi:hypothetical protein
VKLSWASFVETICRFNNYFDQVSPLFWRFGFISVLILPAAIILLWKKNKRLEAWTIAFVLLAILGSLFMEKTKESGYSLFFSGGRFFLAMPFVFIFLSLYFYAFLSTKNKLKFNRIALLLVVVSFGIKTIFFSPLLLNAIDKEKAWYVHVVRIDELKKQCHEMNEFGNHPALLVAVTGDTPEQPVTYGCQPNSLPPIFRITKEEDGLFPNITRLFFLLYSFTEKTPHVGTEVNSVTSTL